MHNEINHIDALITRYLTGNASPMDEEELMLWKSKSPDNQRYFEEISKAFAAGKSYWERPKTALSLDLDTEWKSLRDKIQLKDLPKEVKSGSLFNNTLLKMAASIALLMVSALVIYQLNKTDKISYKSQADTRELTLPDNSIITLNSESQLYYYQHFNKENREVYLEGEAFFSITPDKEHPFLIHANNTIIQVLGTSFNVSAYPSQDNVAVVVETGVVKFSVPENKKGLILKPGDKGIYYKAGNEFQVNTNVDPNFLSWKTRHIVFDGTTLSDVINTLNKVYHSQIELASGVNGNCQVTVTFDHQDLNSVLKVLKATLNFTYKTQDNKIIITQTGC